MINELQMKLLPKGEHSNTAIAKRFKTKARPVTFYEKKPDENGKMVDTPVMTITPNRSQRRKLSKDKIKAAQRRRKNEAAHEKKMAERRAKDQAMKDMAND